MKTSQDHILVTHVGSLPRDPHLAELGPASEEVRAAAREMVERQLEAGIEVVNDGEVGRASFLSYVNDRLGGFEPADGRTGSPWAGSREFRDFPAYYRWAASSMPSPAAAAHHMRCTGPITYRGQAELEAEIANLKAAVAGREAAEVFMTAISPGNVEEWQENAYYSSDEEFLFAIAEALRVEYRAIVDAGLVLQIDDPRLVTYYVMHPEASVEECRRWARTRVKALNHALEGIPRDRVRFHTCYSINIGPRVHDMELKDIIDVMLEVRAGAFSFEAANPRHEHEWKVWQQVEIPQDVVLIPGAITNSSVMIEHPEVVADRLERFARVVGRERVIAGADCGFASFAGNAEMDETVVWHKLRALAEGARIASGRLW